MNMENMRLPVLLVSLVLVFGLIAGCTSSSKSSGSGAGTETFKLSSTPTGAYQPQEMRAKLGATVRIEGDPATLVGGMDTIIVDGYGVSKKVSPGDNVLEFVADKPGEYRVHCANQMGNGKLIVG